MTHEELVEKVAEALLIELLGQLSHYEARTLARVAIKITGEAAHSLLMMVADDHGYAAQEWSEAGHLDASKFAQLECNAFSGAAATIKSLTQGKET